MSDKEELFEKPPEEVKTIDEEPEPKEVKVVEEPPKQYTKKGKERKKNKDGTYRAPRTQTPEQRERMLACLAKGREKARQARLMKGEVTRAKKAIKRETLEKEFVEIVKKKNNLPDTASNEEIKELKREMAELKKLIKDLGSKPKTTTEKEKVNKSVASESAPIIESVPVEPVKESAPVVVEEPSNLLPIPPVVVKKSIRAKSVWSQFI
jgi:hypothetical protein